MRKNKGQKVQINDDGGCHIFYQVVVWWPMGDGRVRTHEFSYLAQAEEAAVKMAELEELIVSIYVVVSTAV